MTSGLDERKTAGASYILSFYNEIHNFKVVFSQYFNVILEIKTKVGEDIEVKKLEEESYAILKQAIQTMRISLTQVYISYSTIKQVLEKDLDKEEVKKIKIEIKDSYKRLKEQYVMNVQDLENLLINLSRFLLTGIVKDLLKNSNDIVGEIYKDG